MQIVNLYDFQSLVKVSSSSIFRLFFSWFRCFSARKSAEQQKKSTYLRLLPVTDHLTPSVLCERTVSILRGVNLAYKSTYRKKSSADQKVADQQTSSSLTTKAIKPPPLWLSSLSLSTELSKRSGTKFRELSLNFPKLADWLCMGWPSCLALEGGNFLTGGHLFCTTLYVSPKRPFVFVELHCAKKRNKASLTHISHSTNSHWERRSCAELQRKSVSALWIEWIQASPLTATPVTTAQ